MATKHKIRDKIGRIVEVESSPRKAIRRMCIECMCFVDREVANCTSIYCPLYAFRSGKNEELTDEQRKQMSNRTLKHNFGRATDAESAQNQEIVS